MKLPKKLKSDAIVEAVLELRFDTDNTSKIIELLIGRFADTPEWRDYQQTRLPLADFPEAVRRSDPNLRYQPIFQLSSADGQITVGIGPQTLLYSRKAPYPGWDKFGEELQHVVARLFEIVPKAAVSRIGLRYVNALSSVVHGITSIEDLDLSIKVGTKVINDSVNLNYKSNISKDIEVMTRIASVNLAEGSIPDKVTVIVDIDVFTPNGFSSNSQKAVMEYIEHAHESEKISFFGVLGKEVTDRLTEAK